MRYVCWIVVAFGLPLSVSAADEASMMVDLKFDQTNDGIVTESDWQIMSKAQKITYARMALEAVGENPDAVVTSSSTRENLLIEGLNAVYSDEE